MHDMHTCDRQGAIKLWYTM